MSAPVSLATRGAPLGAGWYGVVLITIDTRSPIYSEYGCDMATVCVEQLLNLWSGSATAWSLGLAGVDFSTQEEEPPAHEVPQRYRDRNGVWRYADAELETSPSQSEASEGPGPTEKDETDSYVSMASGNGSRRG